MKKVTRVCLITECPYSGVLRSVIENAKILKKNGLEIDFILPSLARNRYGETQERNEKELNKIGRVLRTPLRRKIFYLFFDKNKLKTLLEDNKYLFIVSYSNYAGKICRLLYKEKIINNLVHSPQCIDYIRRNIFIGYLDWLFEKYLSSHVKYYWCSGSSEMEKLINKFDVERKKIVLMSNSIDVKEFTPKNPSNQYIILGRLSKDKRVKDILKVLHNNGLDEQVSVIGSGSELKRLIKKYNHINFFGFVNHSEVFKYFLKSKFFISNSKIEGLPFSLLEAMSCGVVPIVSRVPGHVDIIREGENGFLFSDLSELKEILYSVQKMSKENYDVISQNATKTILNLRKNYIFSMNDFLKLWTI